MRSSIWRWGAILALMVALMAVPPPEVAAQGDGSVACDSCEDAWQGNTAIHWFNFGYAFWGYTNIDYGYNWGSCWGHGHLPYACVWDEQEDAMLPDGVTPEDASRLLSAEVAALPMANSETRSGFEARWRDTMEFDATHFTMPTCLGGDRVPIPTSIAEQDGAD